MVVLLSLLTQLVGQYILIQPQLDANLHEVLAEHNYSLQQARAEQVAGALEEFVDAETNLSGILMLEAIGLANRNIVSSIGLNPAGQTSRFKPVLFGFEEGREFLVSLSVLQSVSEADPRCLIGLQSAYEAELGDLYELSQAVFETDAAHLAEPDRFVERVSNLLNQWGRTRSRFITELLRQIETEITEGYEPQGNREGDDENDDSACSAPE